MVRPIGTDGGKKKEKKFQIEELEREGGALEAQLSGNRSEELCRRFIVKQTELRELAENEARKYAQVTHRRLYDNRDKASKLTRQQRPKTKGGM
ncbi:hypothetical protein NDU88_000504 [Pleurodeles waltl]|uniref:Uncharacterized protein n=1 Tax=Pleurodeles waltl TaxID=8319 RepID=A0AAV7UQP9_PLEWA|nr:hypothetical protein NDU88_000504 [Pleurodeles waltl]